MSTIPHNNRFTGLNALRFFAAYLVVLHHGETIRHKYGLPNFEGYSFFQNGALAVSFFFVLSGFLITYLLVVELHKTGDVALKKFYWRRILRIFPLYYLLVIIGLCVLPLLLHVMNIPNTQPYSTATGGVLFAFFLSFVVNALYSSHFLEPLWSIGVEEYFYLMWAPLFKFFRQKQTPNLAKRTLYIIGFIIVIKVIFILFFHFFPSENAIVNVVKEVILTLKFELMAIGGLGAYMVFYHREKLETAWFFKPIFQVIFFGFLFIRIFLHLYIIENSAFIYDVYKFMIFTPVIGSLLHYPWDH